MIDLTETILYDLNDESDKVGSFYVDNEEEREIAIFINTDGLYEPCVYLRDSYGSICRIKLKENTYYRLSKHDKLGPPFKLTSSEEKAFNDYMKKPVPGTSEFPFEFTNWMRLCIKWNAEWCNYNNGDTTNIVELTNDIEQPEYFNIQEP